MTRMTLEQLKKLSLIEMYNHWEGGAFPFEFVRSCAGGCLTIHASDGCDQHPVLVDSVRQLGFGGNEYGETEDQEFGEILLGKIEELYALRQFHDAIYEHPAELELQQEAIAEQPTPATVPR